MDEKLSKFHGSIHRDSFVMRVGTEMAKSLDIRVWTCTFPSIFYIFQLLLVILARMLTLRHHHIEQVLK